MSDFNTTTDSQLDNIFQVDEPIIEKDDSQTQHAQNQNDADLRQDINYLKQMMESNQRGQQQTQTKEDDSIYVAPVRWDPQGKPLVAETDLNPIIDKAVKKQLAEFQQNNIDPYMPAMAHAQQSNAVSSVAAYLQQLAPDLLEGRDPNEVGKLAIDMYNSAFNPYEDEGQRAHYAIEQLRGVLKTSPTTSTNRELPKVTGYDPKPAPAYNQVGRTQSGGGNGNPYGYAPNSTITVNQKSLDDLGGDLDMMERHAGQVNDLMAYNQSHSMGWKFVFK